MRLDELGQILRDMYQGAPQGEKVVMIHLFGVKYAEQITALDGCPRDVALAAGINESYGTEIHKGVRLAKYVTIRNDTGG